MLMGRMVEHRPTEQLFLAPSEQETADYIEGRYG
jgi:ABC-type phosphate transport system ATPase subunit